MFKTRTTKPVQKSVQQKKQVLTRKGRIQSFGNFPSGNPSSDSITINGIVNVSTKITLQSFKNVTFKNLKMKDNSENTIEFVGESLKFKNFSNTKTDATLTDKKSLDIYVKSSKSKSDDPNRTVVIDIPTFGGDEEPVVNWKLFADSTTFNDYAESTNSVNTNMAPHVVVTKNMNNINIFANDNINYITEDDTEAIPSDNNNPFSYLEASLVNAEDKSVNGDDIWYSFAKTGETTYEVQVYSDSAKETQFTGDIYYPFRNRGGDTVSISDKFSSDDLSGFTFIYSNNVHFNDESGTNDPIVCNEKIQGSSTVAVDFVIKKSVKMASEFDKNNNAESKIIRYNANTYTVAETDNGTTTYPEKPADEWVIDTSVQFNDGNIKYESGNSSISSKVKVEGGYSGYIFGEPKLTIEPTGQLTVGTAVLESKRTNLPVYGDATYYNLILTGISTLDIQEGKNEENQPICGKISCGEFIL